MQNCRIYRFVAVTFIFYCFSLPLFSQERPNIIFILTDDQRWDALGHAGNEIIRTPNMDKLAQEGIYFKNAFVTTPICAASRASIIVSKHERSHGYTFQQPPVSAELLEESYFRQLQKAGYHNGFLGKMGVRLENRLDTTLFDYYKPEGANFYKRKNPNGPDSIHLTELMTLRAIEFIENAPGDKPFCLSINYNAPHAEDRASEQYFWPESVDDLYTDIDIPPPAMGSDSYFESQPKFVRNGFNRTRWYWRFDSPEKYQKMVKGYYRMISGIDRSLGEIRDKLESAGLDKNTIIIFMSDNGYFLGERQLAGKWLMYEPSIRVPLIFFDPRSSKGREVDNLVTNLDVAPTILDLAGIPIPNGYEGISLAGYADKKKGKPRKRKYVLTEHLWKFDNIPASEGVRTRRYKYFRYLDHPDYEELYDLKRDSDEVVNLASTKRSQRKIEKLKTLLNDH